MPLLRSAVFCLLSAAVAAAAPWKPAPAALNDAWEYSRTNRGFALIVMQHGQSVMERYADGAKPGVLHKIYSGTKGFWCVAALAAQADGLLTLDEFAAETLPEWRSDPRKSKITLRQLLNFTAGLDPGFHLHSEEVPDRDAYAVALPCVARPGTAFIYGPGQIQAFCEVLRRKLRSRGEMPYGYLTRRVLRPLGLEEVSHKTDAQGNPLMATGFQLTARQWSRFGLCLLAGGKGILPPGALGESLQGTGPNPAFGMGFWVNATAPGGREVNVEEALAPKWWQVRWNDVCLCREAPRDLFVSLGSMGQRLYVVPSLDLVVVRMSADSRFSDAEFLRRLLEDR